MYVDQVFQQILEKSHLKKNYCKIYVTRGQLGESMIEHAK